MNACLLNISYSSNRLAITIILMKMHVFFLILFAIPFTFCTPLTCPFPLTYIRCQYYLSINTRIFVSF